MNPERVPPPPDGADELRAVAERYARRAADPGAADRDGAWRPEVLQAVHERQRVLLRLLARHGVRGVDRLAVLDVGCGGGGTLLELLRLGFAPAALTGIELLPARLAAARAVLPPAVRLVGGDALAADVAPASQDLVLQQTVFSSLLDDAFQQRLAAAMWSWVRPGGAVVWYDFAVDNPRNPDVRGVPVARLRALFPHAAPVDVRRVTLAPPLARALARLHPALLPLGAAVPWLRTHRLAWLGKPAGAG